MNRLPHHKHSLIPQYCTIHTRHNWRSNALFRWLKQKLNHKTNINYKFSFFCVCTKYMSLCSELVCFHFTDIVVVVGGREITKRQLNSYLYVQVARSKAHGLASPCKHRENRNVYGEISTRHTPQLSVVWWLWM